jgi:hypothetical protein
MKIIPVFLFFNLLIFAASGQSCCKDSLFPADPYYQCNIPEYEPVCGCDGITYRNSCAAEHWGGLVNNGFCPPSWIEGICGNFDFDFTPTGITNHPVVLSVYMRERGTATLYVYDRYGALVYTEYMQTYIDYSIVSRQIDFQFLNLGIYLAMVVVNGEHQTKKFGKLMYADQ